MTFTTNSPAETLNAGARLGEKLSGGEFIVLVGDLGGGKTQYTKGLAQSLGIADTIVSPTFTIERVYSSQEKDLQLHHFDFYRLGTTDMEIESEVTDLEKDPQNIIVIEWGKNIPRALPENYLEITFEYIDETGRKVSYIPHGRSYAEIVKELE
jgi:tRNA threonylcarbamoyladenosine biosynthesis protein TsaE